MPTDRIDAALERSHLLQSGRAASLLARSDVVQEMLATAAVLAHLSRAALVPSGRRMTPLFKDFPYELGLDEKEPATSQALFVDGRDTGLRVPLNYRVSERANRRGDLARSLEGPFSGAYSGTVSMTFVKSRGGRFRRLPIPSGHRSLRLIDVDAKDRVLTLATDYDWGPCLDDPQYGLTNAVLWKRGVPTDLGVASGAAFAHDGAVQGWLTVDRLGKPVNGMMSGTPGWHKVRFRWKRGVRIVYQA